MKQQFLSIAEYIESLEQRIAALEARLEVLETPSPSQEPLAPLETPSSSQEPLAPLETPSSSQEPLAPLETPSPEPTLFGPAVENIRQAISLGDRFLFQRELFNNDGELMQRTLDELDTMSNLPQALQHLARFNWDQESTTYKLFLNVLNRRF